MADNKPVSEDDSSKKWSNPFKKVLGDVKKLIKSEEKHEEIVEHKPPVSNASKEKNTRKPEKTRTGNLEKSETEEPEKETKSRKAKMKEQKLPKKYRKGW